MRSTSDAGPSPEFVSRNLRKLGSHRLIRIEREDASYPEESLHRSHPWFGEPPNRGEPSSPIRDRSSNPAPFAALNRGNRRDPRLNNDWPGPTA